ncbi:hypothetical protein AVEN_162036-1 [Araneus ventricosus]|uniref:Uncharacterized protein n=1 Tax=Araneus ventricosus TaxID=182803 RepID=A0A4Y2D731_ARAVE|nr:hypothetical protein AVEN_241049-1 [Araneus ventricosus]GBM12442.1 hypothetical protein AVEN_248415-1 [Araneus ventricosus]GBM12515.1 hypothetical protein AVEN_154631-1 [Araneus ventricosus]GBM12530.1 hypothetical protein AVEN_162036-1 [Araneus ventricosus]
MGIVVTKVTVLYVCQVIDLSIDVVIEVEITSLMTITDFKFIAIANIDRDICYRRFSKNSFTDLMYALQQKELKLNICDACFQSLNILSLDVSSFETNTATTCYTVKF